ncbi:MAG TPA: glycosyltransferase family 2 protein [Bryobacteraceae bacterium]|jgi:succinoglycan biosynthesis protein ExoA|nr:glycosyltransferase family 2 protein [Bryobacteraceae bacterium]
MTPLVSVVVPCRNEVRFIARCLDSIFNNDYPSVEVLVADGLSTDGTRHMLTELADSRLRVIDNPERITPVALNRAIAAARGEIILRFDAHAVMPRTYITQCVDLLLARNADNVGGSIRTLAQTRGPFSGPIAAVLSSRFGVGNSSFRTTAGRTHSSDPSPRPADTVFGGCWRRDLFHRIGGFNEKLARSQDIEFNLRIARAGGTILLDPKITCDYYARSTLASFWSHNFSNGVWAVLPFAFSVIVPVRPRHLIPLAFVLSLAASAIFPFPWSIAVLSAYAALNFAASIQAAIVHRRWSYIGLMPIAFANLHLAYGIGSAWGATQLAPHLFRSEPKSANHASNRLQI